MLLAYFTGGNPSKYFFAIFWVNIKIGNYLEPDGIRDETERISPFYHTMGSLYRRVANIKSSYIYSQDIHTYVSSCILQCTLFHDHIKCIHFKFTPCITYLFIEKIPNSTCTIFFLLLSSIFKAYCNTLSVASNVYVISILFNLFLQCN